MTDFMFANKDMIKMLRDETNEIVSITLRRITEFCNNLPDDPEMRHIVFNSIISGIFGKILSLKFEVTDCGTENMQDYYKSFCEATYVYFETLVELNRMNKL